MRERFFIALYATSPAALLLAVLLQLHPPPGWTAPALRPSWAYWACIAAWLAASAVGALFARKVILWRVALGAWAVLMAGAALAGLALGSALRVGTAGSLALLALACTGLAAWIGEQRVRQHRPAPSAPRRPGSHGAPGRSVAVRLWHGLPFWIAVGLLLESFRLAHVVGTEPARGSGMVGMLAAFFLLLPAACLRAWLPRTAAGLMLLGALAYGVLAMRAGLAAWWAGAGLCLGLAAQALQPCRVQPQARNWQPGGAP